MKISSRTILLLLGFGLSGSAVGQNILEEVVVTAQKREQSLQDVPISVTAFSGRDIRSLGFNSTIDLAAFTPGMSIGQNSGEGDFPFISLRGVTLRDFADTNESPSAVYIDEFYKANLMGLDQQIFDMDRVEVLRGPQGTLYGRNATGGLIHYVTRKPTETFEGYGEFEVGEYDTYKFEGAVGGPLTQNLSGRLSVQHHQHDGYTENIFPGNADGNALDSTSVRGQLLFTPTEDLSVSVLLQRNANDNDAGNMFPHVAVVQDPVTGLAVDNPGGPGFAGYIEPTPNDPRDTNANRDIYLRTEQYTGIGRIEWNVNGIDVVSITGYEKTSKDAAFDSDGTPFTRGTEAHPNGEQFSQELRLSGQAGPVEWLGGFYYIDYDVDGFQSRCTPATCDVQRAPVIYDLQTESWAFFGNVDVELAPQWSVTAGLRYTQEDKEYLLDNQDFGIEFSPATVGDQARLDDDNISFNARLNYTPTEDLLFYGGVSRGHKSGTFNVGFTPIAFDAIPVEAEQLTSYEVGFKSTLMQGLWRVNGAAFYYDYDDSQAFQFDGRTLSATAFNRDAEVYGAELEVTASPTERLDLMFTATYLDATLKDVERPGPLFTGLPPVDTVMPLAPDWDLSLLARYYWPVPWGGEMALQGSVNYKSKQYFDAFNSPSHLEGGYAVGNARLTWTSANDNWEVAVFANNITDTEYRTYAFDLAFLGFATDVYGKPRWVGGSVRYSWQ
ncbi:MAG: TonB-dependent receptor [Gammaproteobacteria bacterium]